MALARRPRQALRRSRRAVDAVRGADGGVLHAHAGQDHQSAEGPGGVLMAGKTTRVVMPQLGESVHEGTISKWLVKPGDKVVEFEPMLEVDTDKVNAEVPAPVSGILREILAKEGDTVQAGAEIAVVETGDGAQTPSPPPAGRPPSPAPAGEGRGEGRPPSPAPAGEGRGEGRAPSPAPAGEGRGEGRPPSPAPAGEGRGEGLTPSPAPAGEGRGEGRAPSPAPAGEGRGEGLRLEEPHRYSPGV